jgi:hypothetical protein
VFLGGRQFASRRSLSAPHRLRSLDWVRSGAQGACAGVPPDFLDLIHISRQVGMKLSGATIADIVVGGPANRHPDLEIGDTIVKVCPRFAFHLTLHAEIFSPSRCLPIRR